MTPYPFWSTFSQLVVKSMFEGTTKLILKLREIELRIIRDTFRKLA